MYQITDSVLKNGVYSAFIAKTREFRQRLSFGLGTGTDFSEQISFEKGITKAEISQEGNSDSGGLVFGSCCASSCTAEFYNPDKSYNYNGKTMFIECGVKIADGSFFYIPCGYYKVDKPETDDDWHTVKVVAYDAVDDMTAKWNTDTAFPSDAYVLLGNIAQKYNLELDIESDVLAALQSRAVTEEEALTLTSYTEREACGFLAGLAGANVRINTVGKLAVKRYPKTPTDEFNIAADIQWQNGFKKTAEKEFTINSVTSGIDDTVFTAGTGVGISFANPIITENEIAALYDIYAGASFQPSSCEWRGNPCVECGDTVTVTDRNGVSYTVYVANQVIDLTGGLSMNTHCPGGDAEISFDTVNERIRAALNRQYTKLQQAIANATNAIKQTQGSRFELIPDEKDETKNIGFKLHYEDAADPDFNDCVIVGNAGGIAFSSDNCKSFSKAAIYFAKDESGIIRGYINGEFITANSISADMIDADSITAKHLAADSVDADAICTGAITADKLAVGTGKLTNLYFNSDFSKSADNVPGWDGYNTVFRRHTKGVEAIYVSNENMLDDTASEFKTTDGWAGVNCTLKKPYENVDFIRILPNSASTMARVETSVYLENGKKYSVSAQINPYNWASTDSNFINSCMGYCVGGVCYAFTSVSDFSTPVTGESNINFVFLYKGETGYVNLGLFFGGMLDSSGGATGINIAWVAVNETDRNIGFYASRQEWLKENYKKAYLINNGSTIETASEFITLYSNGTEETQIMFQKKYLENGKRYSLVAQLQVLEFSSLAESACFGVWGQNSDAAEYSPEQLNINGIGGGVVTVKFVFDYTGETGFADLGIVWKGLKKASGTPCELFFFWYQLYQDDTDEPGFYSSDAEWLNESYKTSHLLLSETSYNAKPALVVEDDDVYFFGNVNSSKGSIGCLKYGPDGLNVEAASYFYEDASQPDLSEQGVYSSSISTVIPEGVLDMLGLANEGKSLSKNEIIEYISAKTIFEFSDGSETARATIYPYGIKAEESSGDSLLFMPSGIGFSYVDKLSLKQIRYLIKNTPELS